MMIFKYYKCQDTEDNWLKETGVIILLLLKPNFIL